MYALNGLEPAPVFRVFEEICRIPHGSGDERALSDYCAAYGQARGLQVLRDGALNVLIRKPGKGPAVILQGHIDMVCEKNAGTPHNFLTDPLKLRTDGEWVWAEGTTLGADNGLGAAMALAALDIDTPMPPLEILLTTGEETGLLGAHAVDPAWLTGGMLINLDTEEDGILMSGCAGGAKPTVRLPVSYAPTPAGTAFRLFVHGLLGGHSGMEIDKGRGNAILLLARAIDEAGGAARLVSIGGGTRDNAIPRETEAVVFVPAGQEAAFRDQMAQFERDLKREFRVTDPDVAIAVTETSAPAQIMDEASHARVIAALFGVPSGVLAMSADVPGLVETSNNIGAIKTTEGAVEFVTATRSNVASRLRMVNRQIAAAAAGLGGAYALRAEYPAWEYDPASPLRALLAERHMALFGQPAKVEAVHAGLECGLFIEKRPGLDAISFGPEILGAHTPDERANVASTARAWALLTDALARLAEGQT